MGALDKQRKTVDNIGNNFVNKWRRMMSNNENVILNSIQIVLSKIKECGPISKQELKRTTGLSWAAVSVAIKELLEANCVVSFGKQESYGPGRRAEAYEINSYNNFFVGIDFHFDGILCVVTDLKGRVIKQREEEFILREREYALKQLYNVVDDFFDEFQDKRIWGIGIGVQGLVDVHKGESVAIAKIKDWNNVPLKQLLEARYQVEVCMLHDPDCLMKTENTLGCLKGRNMSDVVVVSYSSRHGIGMSIMANGQILHGTNGQAAEIGYERVQGLNGQEVLLGEQTTRESVVKMYSHLAHDDTGITYGEFERRMQNGDMVCNKTYQILSENIGRAISSACILLDPEAVILHISACAHSAFLFECIRDVVLKYVYDQKVEMWHSKLENNAIAVGSALVMVENVIREGKVF